MTRNGLNFITLLICAFLLSACGPQAVEGVDLTGTEWVLTSLDGDPPIQGTEITLFFEEDRLGGSAGCNQYGAAYAREGDELAVGEIESTLILCESPAGVMEQEARYLDILRQAQRVSTLSAEEGELPDLATLEIVSQEGAVLTYVPLPE